MFLSSENNFASTEETQSANKIKYFIERRKYHETGKHGWLLHTDEDVEDHLQQLRFQGVKGHVQRYSDKA